MKQEQNSFSRLWTYLRAYRLEVCLSIFLKILSVVMSVVEPFVLGLAITELTKKSHGYGKRPFGSKSEYLLYRYHYDALSIPWGPL